jgi:hypothetical protein
MNTNEVFVAVLTVIDGEEHYRTVHGLLVAPGLALTPAFLRGEELPDVFALVHIGTGRCISPLAYCPEHAGEAVKAAIRSGIDWTAPTEHIFADTPRWEALTLELQFWVSCAHTGART